MSQAGNEGRALEGRAALVTGASSGLGRATAIALARAGADVALVARSEQELEGAREEISKTGRRALADEGKEYGIRAIVLYPGAMATNWGAFSPEERRQSEPNEAPATQVLAPERVAEFIAWFVASPSEFVLTEGIVLSIEEGLP